MSVFEPGFRWLFCLTHPDDEIAIGAWIRRLTKSGCDVFLSWSHDTPIREEEARAAAEMLGVPQNRLIMLILTWYEVWQALRLRPIELRKRELLREQTHKDFLKPNLPEPLARKVTQDHTWKRWVQLVKQFGD